MKRKVLAVLLALTMVLSVTGGVFAAEGAAPGYVSVSVTYNNFDTDGSYTGDGWTNLEIPVENFQVSLEELEMLIEYGMFKETFYLPEGVVDPQNGASTVIDAILVMCIENDLTFQVGWDSYSNPNGTYISNIGNYPLTTDPVTYFEGENGNKWGRSAGTGWNIAYTDASGEIVPAYVYTSNIKLTDGMDIIADVSKYDLTWDTGEVWTN